MTPEHAKQPLVLALARVDHHHYAPFAGALPYKFHETARWDAGLIDELRPDLLLTPSGDWYEADACIRRCRELQIPTLLMMDGIIEWRHEWEDPKMGAAFGVGYYQPVTADKVACIGRQSARLLASWGNAGKCEIVGIPRLDSFLRDPVPPPPESGKKVMLVMTANKPGFTAQQMRCVELSLASLASCIDRSVWDVIWRVKPALKAALNLTDFVPGLEKFPLREVLARSHAVITTPSTAQLEAMLSARPTALLDFTNSPHYVPAAWTITAVEHMLVTLADLASPPKRRMLYQDFIMHDAVECGSPSSPRMVELMCKMVEAGITCRREGRGLSFDPHILPAAGAEDVAVSQHYDLSALYPDNPALSNRNLADLQRQLVFARQEIRVLRAGFRVRNALRKTFSRLSGEFALQSSREETQ